jgi:hypothetical protein
MGKMGYSISVDTSEKNDAKARSIAFFVSPEKYFFVSVGILKP